MRHRMSWTPYRGNSVEVAIFDNHFNRSMKRLVHKRLMKAARAIPDGDWEVNPLKTLPGGIIIDPGHIDRPSMWPMKRSMPSLRWTSQGLEISGGWHKYRDAMALEAQVMGARMVDCATHLRPTMGHAPRPHRGA